MTKLRIISAPEVDTESDANLEVNAPLLAEWRRPFLQFLEGPPKMTHYQVIAGE